MKKEALSPPKASHGFDRAATGQRRRLMAFQAPALKPLSSPLGRAARRLSERPEQVNIINPTALISRGNVKELGMYETSGVARLPL